MAEDGLSEVLVINMQSRPEGFGLCYECKDGEHEHCIGVPCECECEPSDTDPESETEWLGKPPCRGLRIMMGLED